MRRLLAILSAFVLVSSVCAASVAAAPAPGEARTNSFAGSFDLVEPWSGRVAGHVVAQFKEPTFKRLVPGALDITWAPDTTADPYEPTGAPFSARESHAQVLRSAFWYADGQTGAEVDGFLCDYDLPNVASCHSFQMGFFVNDDPTMPKMAAFEGTDQWCCSGLWYDVGRGSFELTYFSDTPDFPWYPPPSSAELSVPNRPAAPATGTTATPVSSLTTPTARTTSEAPSFAGNFDLLDFGSPARLVGHVAAQFTEPTLRQPVPGSLDITWAPVIADTGSGWPPPGVRESHARILWTWFSHGIDGFTHARVQGILCDYLGPQNASCHPFQADFAASDDATLPNQVGFGPSDTCCSGPFYNVGKGAFELVNAAATRAPSSRHVGADIMTFWGLEPSWADGTPPWSLPRSDSPLLGPYDSSDPKVAERQIATATSHGVNLFLFEFGWIQPGDPLDRAAQSGLMSAKNVDQVDLAVIYTPDAVAGQGWSQGPDRLRSDFAYLAATYFSQPGYLRVDGRPVVVLLNLQSYWWAFGPEGTNALLAEVKDRYGLYLVGGVWPDTDPANVQGGPYDALTIWGNLWSSLGNHPDGTYTYAEYADAYRGYFSQWRDIALADGFQFVPAVYPGFDNLTYTTNPQYDQAHLVIERDLAGFASFTEYARAMTTAPLNLTLFFTWNDYSEGHAIEPSVDHGDTYLDAIASAFAE
jgi:hypothetical protein